MEDQKTIRYEFGEKNKNAIDRSKLSLKSKTAMRNNSRNKNSRGRTTSRELNKKSQIDSRNDPSLESSSPQSYIGNMIDLTASSGSSSTVPEQQQQLMMVGSRRSDLVNDDNVIIEKDNENKEKGTVTSKSASTTSSSLWRRVARSRRSSRVSVAKDEINKIRNSSSSKSNKIDNNREIRIKEQQLIGKENILPMKKQITYQKPEEVLSEAKSTLENWPFSSSLQSSSTTATGLSLSFQQKRSQYYDKSNNNNDDNNINLKKEMTLKKNMSKRESEEHDYYDGNGNNVKGDNNDFNRFSKDNEGNNTSILMNKTNNNLTVEEQVKEDRIEEKDNKQITQEITVNNMLTFGQNYFNNALRGNCVDIMNNDNNKATATASSSPLEAAHVKKSNYTTLSSSTYASPSTTTANNNTSSINHHRSPFFVPIVPSASSDFANDATTNTTIIKHHHRRGHNLQEEPRQQPSSINTNHVASIISMSQQYPQVLLTPSTKHNHDYLFADSDYSSPIARMRDSRTHNNNKGGSNNHNASVLHTSSSSSPSDTTTSNTTTRRSSSEHSSSFSDIILNTITKFKEQRQQQEEQQNCNETQKYLSKACNDSITSCAATPLGQKVIQLQSKHKFKNCGNLDDVDAAVDDAKTMDDNTTIHSLDESIAHDADDEDTITMTSLFPPKYYNARQSSFSDVASSSVQTYDGTTDDDDDDAYTNHTNFTSQCSMPTTTTNITNQNTTASTTTTINNNSIPCNNNAQSNIFQYMADSIQKFSESSHFLSLLDQYSCTTISTTASNDPIIHNDQHDGTDDDDDYGNTSGSIVASSESIAASSFSKQSFRKVLSSNITNNNDDTRSIFSSDLSSVFRTIDLLPEEPQNYSTSSNTSISKKKCKKSKICNFTPQTFLTELTKGIPLKVHGISLSPNYVQPLDIILTIRLSKFKRGKFNEPKLIWKLVNNTNNNNEHHTNSNSNNNKSIHNNNSSSSNSSSLSLTQGSLDIFDITSIEGSNTSSLNLYPFAIPTCSFILYHKKKTSTSSPSSITTYDNNNVDSHRENSSILFEATSKDEQRRIIHALQNIIPYFTFNLISGKKENCWDFFDSAGALANSFMKDDDFSNLSIEEVGDLCAVKGLNDVTNYLVEKTTVQMKRKEKKEWSGGGSVAVTVNSNANTITSVGIKK